MHKNYSVIIEVGGPNIVRLELGDITTYPADAIVNAANSDLLPGAGVCGAIHRAAGPQLAEECRRLRSQHGPVLPGESVSTKAGHLQAKYVIHTVGPVWHGGTQGEPELLSSSYRESMRIADQLRLHSIAFPAVSTGVFGYPLQQAASVAISTLVESLQRSRHLVSVFVVLFDKSTLDTFASVAIQQAGAPYQVIIADHV